MTTVRMLSALLIVLLLMEPIAAQEVLVAKKKGGGGAPGYLLSEDFESGTNTQWTKASGTANGVFNYATSPAPLVGSYSLFLNETSGSLLVYRNTTNWTAVAATYAYAQVNFGAIGTVTSTDLRKVLTFRDAGTSDICNAGLSTSGGTVYWAVQQVSRAFTSITPVVGTTYHVWLEYVEGAGNGSCSLYVSTDASKPGSPSAARTGLTISTDAVRLTLGAFLDEMDAIIFDKVRVDDQVIGSDPS